MTRLFITLLLALIATPAFGQAYDHPEWTDGSVPARDWSVVSTKPLGDAPADVYEPADPGFTYTEADWITATNGTLDYEQVAGVDQRKFRITCEPGTAKELDPIIAYGDPPPAAHRHMGIGNIGWDENSDYASLRANPSGTCTGGPENGNIYWEPEFLKALPNGLVVGLRPQDVSFYYQGELVDQPTTMTWMRDDTAFISGANPLNYNDTARRAEYAAYGFEYPGSPDTPAGFHGYGCHRGSDGAAVTVSRVASRMKSAAGVADAGTARHLKAEDGSDPWGGACTGTVAEPGFIIANFVAQQCWDGHNLRAPDGRGHMAHAARKSDGSVGNACPTMTVDGSLAEYRQVPQLTTKTTYDHAGFADYGEWYLSSDRMRMTTTECPDATAPCDGVSGGNIAGTVDGVSYSRVSKDPCREVGLDFCAGSTGHFDLIFAWRRPIGAEWQRECLGITVRGVAPTHGPAECNTSQISKFRKLKYGASPDSSLSGGCATILTCTNAAPGNIERYNPLPEGTEADVTITHDH